MPFQVPRVETKALRSPRLLKSEAKRTFCGPSPNINGWKSKEPLRRFSTVVKLAGNKSFLLDSTVALPEPQLGQFTVSADRTNLFSASAPNSYTFTIAYNSKFLMRNALRHTAMLSSEINIRRGFESTS